MWVLPVNVVSAWQSSVCLGKRFLAQVKGAGSTVYHCDTRESVPSLSCVETGCRSFGGLTRAGMSAWHRSILQKP